MGRQVTLPAVEATEEIISLLEYPGKMVRFNVGLVDENGVLTNPERVESYELIDDEFAELMSESPAWAQGKPANTYRNEDLWVFVDRRRENA
jgi:hypothetical protein